MFRISVLMFVLCGALAFSTPVQAGLLELFFPSLAKRAPNVYETLQAPFADTPAPDKKLNAEDLRNTRLPENNVPMDKAHRQHGQISQVVSNFVSQAMLFQGEDYREDLAANLKLFDGDGAKAYKSFLQESNLMKVLESRRYYVRSYVEDVPIVLNAGAVDGRFRWLLEVPVIVSYMDKAEEGYEKGGEATNQKFVVRLQVGRNKKANNPEEIFIETWSGKARAINKK